MFPEKEREAGVLMDGRSGPVGSPGGQGLSLSLPLSLLSLSVRGLPPRHQQLDSRDPWDGMRTATHPENNTFDYVHERFTLWMFS